MNVYWGRRGEGGGGEGVSKGSGARRGVCMLLGREGAEKSPKVCTGIHAADHSAALEKRRVAIAL